MLLLLLVLLLYWMRIISALVAIYYHYNLVFVCFWLLTFAFRSSIFDLSIFGFLSDYAIVSTRSAHLFNNYNIDLRFKADSAKSHNKYSINRGNSTAGILVFSIFSMYYKAKPET